MFSRCLAAHRIAMYVLADVCRNTSLGKTYIASTIWNPTLGMPESRRVRNFADENCSGPKSMYHKLDFIVRTTLVFHPKDTPQHLLRCFPSDHLQAPLYPSTLMVLWQPSSKDSLPCFAVFQALADE